VYKVIFVTRLNGKSYLLNNRLIESAEEKPDTTLVLTSGKIVIIKESLEELERRIIEFEKKVTQFGLKFKE